MSSSSGSWCCGVCLGSLMQQGTPHKFLTAEAFRFKSSLGLRT
jgi:hypothetical protein